MQTSSSEETNSIHEFKFEQLNSKQTTTNGYLSQDSTYATQFNNNHNNNYQNLLTQLSSSVLETVAASAVWLDEAPSLQASENATGMGNAGFLANPTAADPSQAPAFPMPRSKWYLALLALLVLINLIVILGNILVILAVYATAKLRNVTNIFTVSLAIADLLLGVFVLPYAVMFEVLDVWIFGNWWCRGWLVADVWISTASILNLCAISVDRYVAVTRPVKYRSIMTARVAKSIVAGVWVVSFLICCPPLWPTWEPSSSISSSLQFAAPPNFSNSNNHKDPIDFSTTTSRTIDSGGGGAGDENDYERLPLITKAAPRSNPRRYKRQSIDGVQRDAQRANKHQVHMPPDQVRNKRLNSRTSNKNKHEKSKKPVNHNITRSKIRSHIAAVPNLADGKSYEHDKEQVNNETRRCKIAHLVTCRLESSQGKIINKVFAQKDYDNNNIDNGDNLELKVNMMTVSRSSEASEWVSLFCTCQKGGNFRLAFQPFEPQCKQVNNQLANTTRPPLGSIKIDDGSRKISPTKLNDTTKPQELFSELSEGLSLLLPLSIRLSWQDDNEIIGRVESPNELIDTGPPMNEVAQKDSSTNLKGPHEDCVNHACDKTSRINVIITNNKHEIKKKEKNDELNLNDYPRLAKLNNCYNINDNHRNHNEHEYNFTHQQTAEAVKILRLFIDSTGGHEEAHTMLVCIVLDNDDAKLSTLNYKKSEMNAVELAASRARPFEREASRPDEPPQLDYHNNVGPPTMAEHLNKPEIATRTRTRTRTRTKTKTRTLEASKDNENARNLRELKPEHGAREYSDLTSTNRGKTTNDPDARGGRGGDMLALDGELETTKSHQKREQEEREAEKRNNSNNNDDIIEGAASKLTRVRIALAVPSARIGGLRGGEFRGQLEFVVVVAAAARGRGRLNGNNNNDNNFEQEVARKRPLLPRATESPWKTNDDAAYESGPDETPSSPESHNGIGAAGINGSEMAGIKHGCKEEERPSAKTVGRRASVEMEAAEIDSRRDHDRVHPDRLASHQAGRLVALAFQGYLSKVIESQSETQIPSSTSGLAINFQSSKTNVANLSALAPASPDHNRSFIAQELRNASEPILNHNSYPGAIKQPSESARNISSTTNANNNLPNGVLNQVRSRTNLSAAASLGPERQQQQREIEREQQWQSVGSQLTSRAATTGSSAPGLVVGARNRDDHDDDARCAKWVFVLVLTDLKELTRVAVAPPSQDRRIYPRDKATREPRVVLSDASRAKRRTRRQASAGDHGEDDNATGEVKLAASEGDETIKSGKPIDDRFVLGQNFNQAKIGVDNKSSSSGRTAMNVTSYTKKSGCALYDHKSYVIYSALGSFYIPMLIMIFFYSRIYLVASRAQKNIKRGYMTTKWPPTSAVNKANSLKRKQLQLKQQSHQQQQLQNCAQNNASNCCDGTSSHTSGCGDAANQANSTTISTNDKCLSSATNNKFEESDSAGPQKKRGVLGGSFRGSKNAKNSGDQGEHAHMRASENFERVTLRIHRRQASPPDSPVHYAAPSYHSAANITQHQLEPSTGSTGKINLSGLTAGTPTSNKTSAFGPESELVKLATIFKREQEQLKQQQQQLKSVIKDVASPAVASVQHTQGAPNAISISTRHLRRQSAIEREQSSENASGSMALSPPPQLKTPATIAVKIEPASQEEVKSVISKLAAAPINELNHPAPIKKNRTPPTSGKRNVGAANRERRRLSRVSRRLSSTQTSTTITTNTTCSQDTLGHLASQSSMATLNDQDSRISDSDAATPRRRRHKCRHHHQHHRHHEHRYHPQKPCDQLPAPDKEANNDADNNSHGLMHLDDEGGQQRRQRQHPSPRRQRKRSNIAQHGSATAKSGDQNGSANNGGLIKGADGATNHKHHRHRHHHHHHHHHQRQHENHKSRRDDRDDELRQENVPTEALGHATKLINSKQARPPAPRLGGASRLMMHRHSIAGHEMMLTNITGLAPLDDDEDNAAKQDDNFVSSFNSVVAAAKRGKRSLADLSHLIKCSSIAEESPTQSNSQGSLNNKQHQRQPTASKQAAVMAENGDLTSKPVQIMVSLASGASEPGASVCSMVITSAAQSNHNSSGDNSKISEDDLIDNYGGIISDNKPTFGPITPPPPPTQLKNNNTNNKSDHFPFVDHDDEDEDHDDRNINKLVGEQHQLLSLGPRVDRSQSCTPGTPTIVVNWSPGSNGGMAEGSPGGALGGQLALVSSHLANSESAVAECSDNIMLMGEQMGQSTNQSNMQRNWTTTNSESLGSGLALFPNQVRKQSIMLLNTLTLRGSQTLRRLSVAAQHPLDTLLRRSRSHEPRERDQRAANGAGQSSDHELAGSQHTRDVSINMSQHNHNDLSSSARRKRKRHTKTLDDYLMSVAGIDSSSSSLSSSNSSLSNVARSSDYDDYDDDDDLEDDDDLDNDYDRNVAAYYGSSEDELHRRRRHRRSISDDAIDSRDFNDANSDINAESYSESRKCHLTSLLQRERIRLPCLKVVEKVAIELGDSVSAKSGSNSPGICITVNAADENDQQQDDATPRIFIYESSAIENKVMSNANNAAAGGQDETTATHPVRDETQLKDGKCQIVTTFGHGPKLTNHTQSCVVKNNNNNNNHIKTTNTNHAITAKLSFENQPVQVRQSPASTTLIVANKRATVRRRGKRTSRWHAKRLRAETKAAKTVAIIIGGFISCWLPFFTAYLGRAVVCESPDCVPQAFLSLFIWLGYLNSAINPVIYGLVSADFRQAFKNIVCRCSFRNPRKDDSMVVSALVDNIIKSIL